MADSEGKVATTLTQVLVSVLEWIDGRPKWLHPPLYGALFIYAFMAFRGAWIVVPVALAITALKNPVTALHLLLGIAVYAPLGGFVGGALYTLTNPIMRYLGKVGTFVQCLLAGLGYGVVLNFLIAPTLDGKPIPSFSDPSEWTAVLLVGLIGGIALGVPMVSEKAS